MFDIHYQRYFASLHIADLKGISGNIGYHLEHSADDYLVYGRAGYRVRPDLAIYGFLTQERYTNVGPYGSNSLTYQGAGVGMQFSF